MYFAYYENYRHGHTWHPAPPNQTTSRCFVSETSQCKIFFFFVFCLPSCLMELLWLSTQQGQKRSFPKSSKPSGWIWNCQKKSAFSPQQNEMNSLVSIHQPRLKQKTNNKKNPKKNQLCELSPLLISRKIKQNTSPARLICVYIYIY